MKHTIKIIFGQEQVNKYYNGIELTLIEVKDYMKEYSFDTKEELDAFCYGMDEASGWIKFCII